MGECTAGGGVVHSPPQSSSCASLATRWKTPQTAAIGTCNWCVCTREAYAEALEPEKITCALRPWGLRRDPAPAPQSSGTPGSPHCSPRRPASAGCTGGAAPVAEASRRSGADGVAPPSGRPAAAAAASPPPGDAARCRCTAAGAALMVAAAGSAGSGSPEDSVTVDRRVLRPRADSCR